MYTSQCEGLQMGQRNGVLFKDVLAFGRCPWIEVSLYMPQIVCPNCGG